MNQAEQQLLFFSTLLQLEKQARHAASTTDLIYTIVNESIRLTPYQQSMVWLPGINGNPVIRAVSGVDSPDKNSPFITYSQALLRKLKSKDPGPRQITVEDIPTTLVEGWQEWSFGYMLCCPLTTPRGDILGGVIFTRNTVWQESEISLLQRLTEAYAHALAGLRVKKHSFFKQFIAALPKRIIQLTLLAVIILVLDLPMRLSALAPAEIVPLEPLLVTSPISSVIESMSVRPNQPVTQGETLFTLDSTSLRNEYQVAQKALAVLRTEHNEAKQKSFVDPQSRAKLTTLEATIEQQKAGIAYTKDLLDRSIVTAGRDGIAVYGDVDDWLGRPVEVGQKILTIADPIKIEAQIMLPVEDAITLEPGSEILIFLNVMPNKPIKATLRRASYEARVSEEGVLSFQIKATLEAQGQLPRIGLRGTAKIYGEEVSVLYYLMRKPYTALRQFLAL
nr:HlyD family efflux transporter periplasmic adaptor subunit [Desulfobulbaceae bacterium]